MGKFLTVLFLVFLLSGCAKKYDWTCTCEIYTATSSDVRKKEIAHKSKSDADEDCAKFGEAEAGTGGSHDCNLQAK